MRRLGRALMVAGLAASFVALQNFPALANSLEVQDLTSETLTPTDLAEALVGPDVTVSNVTYTGADAASGTFSGGTGIIGFESGIVLTSGFANNVIGPNDETGVTGVNGTSGDADLDNLSGFATFDAAVLEFDFTIAADMISFNYVFTSDEYNEFVNTQFNDVFAFFVNGNGVNCATVNGDPVSINTVNNGNGLGDATASHAELYINNDPENPDADGVVADKDLLDTQMDGLTVVLTCTADVNPEGANHIKLAIADASDSNLDSAVFLEAGSLTEAEAADLQVTLTSTPDGAVDSPETPAVAGEEIVYHVTVTNNGPDDNAGYTVSFDVPAGTSFVSAPECSLADSTVTCTSTGLPASTSETFDITLDIDSSYVVNHDADDSTVDNQADLSATATITSTETDQGDNTAPDSDTHDVTVIGIADLQVTLTAVPSGEHSGPEFVAGEQADYTITVDNLGPSDNAGYTVTFGVPGGTTFDAGLSSESCTLADSTVTCTSAGITADHAPQTFDIILDIGAGYVVANDGNDETPDNNQADLTATANVVSDLTTDDDDANDSAIVTVDVVGVADLEVTLTAVANGDHSEEFEFVAGEQAIYTITVTNLGPSDNDGYQVTFDSPSLEAVDGTTVVSLPEACSESAVTCDSDFLAAGDSQTFDITLDIDPGFVIANDGNDGTPDNNEALLSATATVASPITEDDNDTNDSATETVTVVGVADLEVTSHMVLINDALVVDPLISGNFNFLTADVVVTNNGPSDAEDVSVTDTYPDPDSEEGSLLDKIDEVQPIGLLPADGVSIVPQFEASVRQDLRDGLYASSNVVSVESSVTDDDDPDNNSDTQPAGVFTVPDAPDLELAEPGNGEIGVQWIRGDDSEGDPDGGDDIEGYDIILTPTSNGTPIVCAFTGDAPNAADDRFSAIVPSTEVPCEDDEGSVTELTNDTTYTVEVVAENGAGVSDRSNAIDATPCADCAVEFVEDGLTILTVETETGGEASILQNGEDLSCEELLHDLGIGATDANPIVVCDEYPDADGANDGLIASLREEEEAAVFTCGDSLCLEGIHYISNVPFGLTTDFFVREVVVLDKSITPENWDPFVFVDGTPIGSSDRDTWCDQPNQPNPTVGCVERIEVLRMQTAPNGRQGVGDVLAVFRFFVNPSKGLK